MSQTEWLQTHSDKCFQASDYRYHMSGRKGGGGSRWGRQCWPDEGKWMQRLKITMRRFTFAGSPEFMAGRKGIFHKSSIFFKLDSQPWWSSVEVIFALLYSLASCYLKNLRVVCKGRDPMREHIRILFLKMYLRLRLVLRCILSRSSWEAV